MTAGLLAACTWLLTVSSVEGSAAWAPRVVVIGVDGASLNLVEPRVAAGVLPNLGKLLAEGARGELASFWPLRTPQVWTSMVTGKLPGQHGIWDRVADSAYNPPPYRQKGRRLLTSEDRKSKALWQLLAATGRKSLTVGWVSTWPAERVEGAVIAAPAMAVDDKRQASIKGSFWRDSVGQIEPASLWSKVRPLIVEPSDVNAADLARYAGIPPPGSPLFALPFIERYLYALRWSIARDTTTERLTLALAATTRPDVVLTYFQCSDSLLHRFWIFQKSVDEIRARLNGHGIASDASAELHERLGGVVDACYTDIDARIGRLLAALRGPETLVLIVSDHGFGEAPVPHPSRDEPYGGNHRDDGLVIAAGPGVTAGGRFANASVLDLTPSLLHLLGLPIGADMRGKVWPEIFSAASLAARPPAAIPSYEATPQVDAPFASGWPERKQRPLAIDQ